jgi:hypothetical protein
MASIDENNHPGVLKEPKRLCLKRAKNEPITGRIRGTERVVDRSIRRLAVARKID